ncbi:invasion associated locus B family protein [Alkalilacustris brevis]|uniref:invasion associated locus B family protein n=1 Tax=Alkalilacustris brevis TaxID=2026338 RepID=UPI000E0D6797|nr:invasion associated locus B family protein [Alkalilacustris brevis]
MLRTSRHLAVVAATLVATGAWAQEITEAPGEDLATDGLSLGEEVGEGFGDSYLAETFNDWEMQCVRMPDGSDPCQLVQLLQDQEGNSVAEISIFGLPPGGEAAAGATVITPLETLLTEQITMRIDGGTAKRYPFTWCAAIGCVARVGFTAAEVESFKRGAEAIMTIVPAAAPDQRVELTISLMGFTAGLDAVNAANQAE